MPKKRRTRLRLEMHSIYLNELQAASEAFEELISPNTQTAYARLQTSANLFMEAGVVRAWKLNVKCKTKLSRLRNVKGFVRVKSLHKLCSEGLGVTTGARHCNDLEMKCCEEAGRMIYRLMMAPMQATHITKTFVFVYKNVAFSLYFGWANCSLWISLNIRFLNVLLQ